jgi:hypothetical protein
MIFLLDFLPAELSAETGELGVCMKYKHGKRINLHGFTSFLSFLDAYMFPYYYNVELSHHSCSQGLEIATLNKN